MGILRPFLSSVLILLFPLACSSFSATTLNQNQSPLSDFDYEKNDKIPWIESGYQTWNWRDYDVNYIEMGDPEKPALILIHGFGGSSYHWRYNLPVLARDYHVFAFCKVGLGLSEKPLEQYSAEFWRDQTNDFLKEVVQKPATVAGNSIGGFTSMYSAATDEMKSMVDGVILLNAAGRFRDSAPVDESADDETNSNNLVQTIQTAFLRLIIQISFVVTKQPMRIEQVMKQIYTDDQRNVDDELIRSIQYPAFDPNAAEVFYRIITRNAFSNQPTVFMDDLLNQMECPLLLCWGENDPWIRPQVADRIESIYPKDKFWRTNLQAGHCPMDETPDEVNRSILDFMKQIHSTSK